jgi:ML domain
MVINTQPRNFIVHGRNRYRFSADNGKVYARPAGVFSRNQAIASDTLEKMLKVLVIFALAQVALAQTPVKPCGNGQAMPRAVYFGGRESFCSKPPCILKRGKQATTEVDFTSLVDASTVTPKAKAKVFGMSFELNLGVKAASSCKLLSKGCPLHKGEATTFKLVKDVGLSATKGNADVEYSLIGDHSQVIFCYKLKTVVV